MKSQVNLNKTRKKILEENRATQIRKKIHEMLKNPYPCGIYTKDPKSKQVLVCAYRTIFPHEIENHKKNHRNSIKTTYNKSRQYEVTFDEYKKLHQTRLQTNTTKPVAAPSPPTTRTALSTATTPKRFNENPDEKCNDASNASSNDIFVGLSHDHIYAKTPAHIDADIDATESCQSNIVDVSFEVLASETSNHSSNLASNHSWITLPHSPSPSSSQLKKSFRDSLSTPKKSLNAIFPHATPP